MSQKTGHERCIIPGCSASNISLHSLPKERDVADKWMDFVFGDLPRPLLNQSFRVCTAHFTPECIQNQGLYDAGVVSRLMLNKGSIPTIRNPCQTIETVSTLWSAVDYELLTLMWLCECIASKRKRLTGLWDICVRRCKQTCLNNRYFS